MEQNKTMTYEEALKAFKAEWADKRKDERKAKAQEKKAEERKANASVAQKALEVLSALDTAGKNELAPAIKRLEMYISGEHYTRVKGGK